MSGDTGAATVIRSARANRGVDDAAVVDPRLRVRGVDRSRVIDSLVMPVLTGGNTNGPTLMMGERAWMLRGARSAPALVN